MVSVNNAAVVPASNAAAAAKEAQPSKTALDYEAFLMLFVAQLKHQDPLEPMDASQSLAQLAMFSQVEQSVATNKKLDALLATNLLTQASDFLGRTVTSAEGNFTGKVASVRVTSEGVLATLEDGRTALLHDGVTIS